VRVFVALDIPSEIRNAIGTFVKRLDPDFRTAHWVRPDRMHLTLKFIGEISADRVEGVKITLSGVRSPSTVRLTFRGTGFFPNEHHPRVFWAGMEATANLAPLAADIERALEPLGVPRDAREFRPHLTLARFKSQGGLTRLRAAIASAGPLEFGAMETHEVHLYESRLERGGAIYTRLASFSFAGES
jgi:2'-5' RNA ligase